MVVHIYKGWALQYLSTAPPKVASVHLFCVLTAIMKRERILGLFMLSCNVCFLVCVSYPKESEDRDLESIVFLALLLPKNLAQCKQWVYSVSALRMGIRKLPFTFWDSHLKWVIKSGSEFRPHLSKQVFLSVKSVCWVQAGKLMFCELNATSTVF